MPTVPQRDLVIFAVGSGIIAMAVLVGCLVSPLTGDLPRRDADNETLHRTCLDLHAKAETYHERVETLELQLQAEQTETEALRVRIQELLDSGAEEAVKERALNALKRRAGL